MMAAEGNRFKMGSSQRPALALGILLSSCTSNTPADPCPDEPPPAFSITVAAVEGPLPRDTRVIMAYGGGSEQYDLGAQDHDPKVMFCETDNITPGAAGMGGAGAASTSATERLTCELWIEGAATVWVSGGDYEPLEVELRGEANECGPETVLEDLVLGQEEPDPEDF